MCPQNVTHSVDTLKTFILPLHGKSNHTCLLDISLFKSKNKPCHQTLDHQVNEMRLM